MSGISDSIALIAGHEAFTLAPAQLQNQTVMQAHLDQQVPLYGASYGHEGLSLYQSTQGGASDVKRKRGRPRKYRPDENMDIATSSDPQQITVAASQELPFSRPMGGPPADPPAAVPGSVSPVAKKRRGRPPGSRNKKKRTEAMGSAGDEFVPHVINVKAGQDVASTLMAFSQHGLRAICILSATGVASGVTLREAASPCGTATYEGSFNILSLSGVYFPSNADGQISGTGGLSIALAGADGRVFGGTVVGTLTTASPVEVTVVSFVPEGKGSEEEGPSEHQPSAPPKASLGSSAGGGSPSQGAFTEYSGGSAAPRNPTAGTAANNNHHSQGIPGMPWK